MKDVICKLSPLSQGLCEGELIMCTVTSKSYLFINNELNLIKPTENKWSLIPQWLIDDIKRLRLQEVRLSCAIYDLYDYYANIRKLELSIEENSNWLDLVNERLDWMDRNTSLIDFAINNF